MSRGSRWTGFARFLKIARLTLIQFLQHNIVTISRSSFFSPATQPDQILKTLRHLHPTRLFMPHAIKDASSKTSLPLVIMIHGGGFVMNKPCADDPLARHLADTSNCIVTSIDYRKAPANQFPAAYEDVVESILALLKQHEKLKIDISKVVLCGISAGGNLALAAAQDNRLQGKLLGIVGVYPVVNLLLSEAELMATRPNPKIPDFLDGQWDGMKEIYVGSTDESVLADPRLSPTMFKSREHLPQHIFIMGCEHDMLCSEDLKMAEKLAGDVSKDKISQDGWQEGTVKWKLIKGQTHAFDVFARKEKEDERLRLEAKVALYQDISVWLKRVIASA